MKKLPETDAIFEHLAQVNPAADADPTCLRLSVDAKATIPLGLFSRGGTSRVPVKAWDHDFRPEATVTPLGVFVPQCNQLLLFLMTGRVTADAISDGIQAAWTHLAPGFPEVQTLLLNLDNGPENHSRRTQFMHRMTQFADTQHLTLDFAYYPPYHSKYNPIERVWGVLEQHWNGALLDSLDTVHRFAETMTYNHVHPVVMQRTQTYPTGVKLTSKAMTELEARFERRAGLEKYFVRISPLTI